MTSDSNVRSPALWPPAVVQAICNVMASTGRPGLTGNEIERLLHATGIPDVLDEPNKRSRLALALLQQQQPDGTNAAIERFLAEAMNPARFLSDHDRFNELRDALAEPLALLGLEVTAQGKLGPATGTATTLDEVAKITGRLRKELNRRGIHPEAIRYCDEELIRRSLFHAVFEATKGVSQRLRQLTGSTADGASLVDLCFGDRANLQVRINAYSTESETSEHRGFANLLRGTFGMFRNPPAHTPRATAGWTLTEADALDLFSLLSLIHRRLDHAQVVPRP
jgi:uncharacterized protein (TIGR02391 family)